ncbi:MAG TPA: hypothetical protein VK034_25380 [Enhygromyxa sp.]|nr:hypothetical protein [Enhygromyxa sp.]
MRAPLQALTIACAVLLTFACGDGAGGSDIEPRSGTWDFMGSDPVDDTCGLPDLYTDPPGQFELTNNGDGTITVDDSENVFDCTLDGSSFSCPERAAGENDVGGPFGLDAVVEYTITATGSFSSDTAMSGRQTIEIVCVGADCAAVEATVGVTTPCGWAQDFTASAQ